MTVSEIVKLLGQLPPQMVVKTYHEDDSQMEYDDPRVFLEEGECIIVPEQYINTCSWFNCANEIRPTIPTERTVDSRSQGRG